jgi:choline dehydrogenase
LIDYQTLRTGILTNTASELLGFQKFPSSWRANLSNSTLEGLAQFPNDWPELEYVFADGYGGYLNDFTTGAPLDGKNYGTVAVGLEAPFSRGTVTLNSSDTAVNPVVNPNLLGDPRDRDVALLAFKRAREIAATHSLQKIIIGDEAFPGKHVRSDSDIMAVIEKSANTIYHASCTCRMGTVNDTMAVVDSKATVIGVKALRVVDASAFAILPPGHPTTVVCK